MARLPGIYDRDKVPDGKQEVYDYIVKTRGKILDMYAILLHSPEIAGRIAHTGSFFKESQIPRKIVSLVASTISAEQENIFEHEIHAKMAMSNGVKQSTVDAIRTKSPLIGIAQEEAFPIEFARELARTHTLSDETFSKARDIFGDRGVVELICAASFYGMLAHMQNALQSHLH